MYDAYIICQLLDIRIFDFYLFYAQPLIEIHAEHVIGIVISKYVLCKKE